MDEFINTKFEESRIKEIHKPLSPYPEIPVEERFKPRFNTGIDVDNSNPTANEILNAIRSNNGTIPYSTFMHLSLYGKEGFYSKGKVQIGTGKDFTTAPEYTEAFGATIGQALSRIWRAMGKPETFRIIEMGAGEGSLAHSLLKWMQVLHLKFYKAIRYTILEYGDLINRQKEKLQEFDNVEFVKGSAYEIPFTNVQGVFLSNELPDAFPVERITRINGEIKQKYITVEDGKWVELWEAPSDDVRKHIERFNISVSEFEETPVNLQAEQLQHGLDSALQQGAILTIDYGYREGGKPKQIIRHFSGKYKSSSSKEEHNRNLLFGPYKYPGEVDLTSDIDFSMLEKVAKGDGLTITFSGTAGDFLGRNNIANVAPNIKKEYPSIVYCAFGLFGDQLCHLLTKGVEVKFE